MRRIPVFIRCVVVLISISLCSLGWTQDSQSTDAQPAEPLAANALETLSSAAFDVTVLNQRLRDEAGMNAEQARMWVERRVRAVLQGKASELGGTSGTKLEQPSLIGVETANGKTVQMSLDGQDRGVLAVGDEVFVIAPKSEFREVKNLIDTLEQFGIRQVLIKTLVLRDSVETMKRLPIRWSHVEAVSKIAHSPDTEVRKASYDASKTLPIAGQTTAALFLQRQKQQQIVEELPAPEGVISDTWTEATSIVERATPVLYTLLTPGEYQTVIDHVRDVPSTERLMSPTVVVFNGQIATISDSVERPFVTGIKPMLVGDDEAKRVEFAPSIKVYPEGTTLKLQPELSGGKRVRLNCQLDLCKVRSVEELEIDGIAGQADFTVQMPEVASTQFRTCLEMPINYALAISAFETDEHGVQRSIVVLCHCSLRNVDPGTTN